MTTNAKSLENVYPQFIHNSSSLHPLASGTGPFRKPRKGIIVFRNNGSLLTTLQIFSGLLSDEDGNILAAPLMQLPPRKK
jgi:hypothetical protein